MTRQPFFPALTRDVAVHALDALVNAGFSVSLSATVVGCDTFWRVESRRHGDHRDSRLPSLAAALGLELLTSETSLRFALAAPAVAAAIEATRDPGSADAA